MADKTKLTIRVESRALERAKEYAATHHTSISKLVSGFLGTLSKETEAKRAPVLNRLTGVLPADASIDDRDAYLAKKYGV